MYQWEANQQQQTSTNVPVLEETSSSTLPTLADSVSSDSNSSLTVEQLRPKEEMSDSPQTTPSVDASSSIPSQDQTLPSQYATQVTETHNNAPSTSAPENEPSQTTMLSESMYEASQIPTYTVVHFPPQQQQQQQPQQQPIAQIQYQTGPYLTTFPAVSNTTQRTQPPDYNNYISVMNFNEFVNTSANPPNKPFYSATKFYAAPQSPQQKPPSSPQGPPSPSTAFPPHTLQPMPQQPHTPLYSLDSRHKFSPYTTLARPISPIQKAHVPSPPAALVNIVGQGGVGGPPLNNRFPPLTDTSKQETKNIADMLQEIAGLEKIRWQSILQGTRGPEVGDRETQRRVKEAEILGSRLFGGDLDKLLGSLLNQHLDFLVYYVKNTLCTPKRRHKKVREMLWRSLSTVREKEMAAANAAAQQEAMESSSNSGGGLDTDDQEEEGGDGKMDEDGGEEMQGEGEFSDD